jgi:hypothetical protein
MRYTARGALSLERLEQDANGALLYRFNRPWSDGTTGINRRSYLCRVPIWCATVAVWRRIVSCGRRSFPPRISRVSMATKRSQELRIGTGRGCLVASLIWIWRPVFRHCVGGGKHVEALRRRSRAKPCDLHPGVGHHPHPAPPQAGLRSPSRSPCSLSPRDIGVRRSLRQRGFVGDVRAATVYFAPSRCKTPFEIVLPQLFRNQPSRGRRPHKPVKRHPHAS